MLVQWRDLQTVTIERYAGFSPSPHASGERAGVRGGCG